MTAKRTFRTIDEMPPFITREEAAAALSVSSMQVLGWIEEGKLLAIDVSSPPHNKKHYRIARDSLKQFVERERTDKEAR
jgi:excisionase family DNA binding protein